MNSLVNECVEHIKFGKGKINSVDNYRLDIAFGNDLGEKSFLYPDAFEKFLKLENDTLQKECFDLAVNKRETLEKEAKELRMEQERLEEERKSIMETTKKKKRTTVK